MFSIIVPTYNRASLLERCLKSVISQTVTDWEAIVVDNYSEDNTEDVVNSFNDQRIVYIKNHNYGVISVSRNKALDMAKGEWICFLDSDDSWYPNKLEEMLPYTKDYDLIYHGFKYNIPRTRLFQKRTSYFYPIRESTVAYVLQRGDPVSPSCACVSRKALGNTRFSEDRSLIAVEDYDFFLQLIDKRLNIKHLKKVLTLYDVNGCTSDLKGAERDEVLVKKWEKRLTDEERKEVELQLTRRKADIFRFTGQYNDAIPYYKHLMQSNIRMKRMIAVRGLILCFYHKLLKLI